MATTSAFYAAAAAHFADAAVDWATGSVSALLTTVAPGAQTWLSEVTGEASGTGYARVGVTGRVVTTTTAGAELGCNDIVFGPMTVSGVQWVVCFVDSGDPATSPLVGYVDLGAPVSTSNQTLTVGAGTLFALSRP